MACPSNDTPNNRLIAPNGEACVALEATTHIADSCDSSPRQVPTSLAHRNSFLLGNLETESQCHLGEVYQGDVAMTSESEDILGNEYETVKIKS